MDKRLINHIRPTLHYNDYPDVLSVNDVAALLQLGRNNAYKLVQSGKLQSVRIGRIHKISKKSLIDFIEGRT
ncbi:MAG: helix-turn-helix domain-containing protein [Clostridia bacterium]|jgi:excisionase family DNA binding protein|nr:helix-turn-helix domain-containing protein [Clostridia bacterium]